MNTQPEALRLADYLELAFDHTEGLKQAAAELRRLHSRELHYEMIDHQNKLLHALNQELLEALKLAQQGIESMTCWEHPDDPAHPWTDCAKQIRTAIAKAEAKQ